MAQKTLDFQNYKQLLSFLAFNIDRINGSHHIYMHPEVPEMINIQNVKGKAKPYQIKQFLAIIERHNYQMEE